MYKLEVFNNLCSCEQFTINGITADEDDFGNKYDVSPSNVPYSGCGDMRFFPKLPTQVILDKYKISVDEYKQIAEDLEEKLSFGSCGSCV